MNTLILFLFILLPFINCDKFHKRKHKKTEHLETKKIEKKRKLAINWTLFPLKFCLDYTNFDSEYPTSLTNIVDSKVKIKTAVEDATKVLESILQIYIDPTGGATNTNEEIEEWGLQTLGDEFKEFSYTSDGCKYIVAFNFSDTIHNIASARLVKDCQNVPLIGIITINPEKIKFKLSNPEFLKTLMVHELIHLLGFHKYVKKGDHVIYQSNILEGEENGNKYYYLKTKKLDDLYDYIQEYFNCEDLEEEINIKLDLDEDGNVHWPKRYFLGEIMTEFDYPEEQVLSKFTLLFLEDTEYFKVNKYYTGGLMRFGKNKGCDFFNPEKNCGDQNDNSFTYANEFYLPTSIEDNPTQNEISCSSGRLSKTIHTLYFYSERPSNSEYFQNRYAGPKSTNYCPISEFGVENVDYIYKGRCRDQETSNDPTLEDEIGEKFTNNSFCVLSSLLKKESLLNNKTRAVCYEMYCSSKSLTIKIKDNYIVCPRSGGKLDDIENFKGYLLCPDYNLICTSKPLCNNLFDCIEEKAEEIDETFFKYINDQGEPDPDDSDNSGDIYTIKTTQNSEIYETDDNLVDIMKDKPWELATEDEKKCPSLCMQCDLNNKCIKCAPHCNKEDDGARCVEKVPHCKKYNIQGECLECEENYFLYQDVANDPYFCKEDEYKKYYYESSNQNHFKRCDNNGIENCEECTSNSICDKCKSGFEKVDDATICGDLSTKLYYEESSNEYKSCFKKSGHSYCKLCEINEGDFHCNQCLEGYAFYYDETEINKCILKTTKDSNKYFTEDNGINYKPCNDQNYHTVEKCETCTRKDECTGCEGVYSLVNSNKLCIKLSDKLYYKDTDNNYYLCSTSLTNCNKCVTKTKCILCNSNSLYPVQNNDGSITCQEINTNYYYQKTEDGNTFYRKCEDDISNCEECSSSTHCTKCKNNFAIIEDDYSKCEDLTTKKYYLDQESGKYKLCSSNFPNCEICEVNNDNVFTCNQCKPNNVFKHENDNDLQCASKTTLDNNNQYYTTDSGLNYYSCSHFNNIEHCLECANIETCSRCQTNYILENDNTVCTSFDPSLCSTYIPNCEECASPTHCNRCINNFATIEDDYSRCEDLSTEKYYKDETTGKYRLCSKNFEKCEKCIIDDNNNFKCKECITNYILKHENDVQCALPSSINTIQFYKFENDEINYYSCKYFNDVENCLECENKENCLKCLEGYTIVNNSRACILQQDIDNHLVYYDNKLGIHVYCSSLISDCQKCDDRENCTSCESGNSLEENNKCISDELIENHKYVLDDETQKYISCSKIDNCDTCYSITACTQCQEGYIVDNNICKSQSNPVNNDDDGLSTGAIVGIVIGCLSFLLMIVGLLLFLIKKGKLFNKQKNNITIANDEENVVKTFSNENNNENNKCDEEKENETKSRRTIHNIK